jgi:hypothetical protein
VTGTPTSCYVCRRALDPEAVAERKLVLTRKTPPGPGVGDPLQDIGFCCKTCSRKYAAPSIISATCDLEGCGEPPGVADESVKAVGGERFVFSFCSDAHLIKWDTRRRTK